MLFCVSLSAALRLRQAERFGNIEILVRDEDEGVYTIRWKNLMNLNTTTLHKVRNTFLVEITNGQSTQLVRHTKDAREALLSFILSADVERIDAELVLEARKHTISQLKMFEGLFELRIPRSAMRLMARRSNNVIVLPEGGEDKVYSKEDLADSNLAAKLLFIYPLGDKAEVKDCDGMIHRVPTSRLWYA